MGHDLQLGMVCCGGGAVSRGIDGKFLTDRHFPIFKSLISTILRWIFYKKCHGQFGGVGGMDAACANEP
jgi:hypothetical protein